MSKVIQLFKSFFHLALHRGSSSPDPYSFIGKLHTRLARPLQQTLGSSQSRPRCSRTFIKSQRNLRLLGIASSFLFLLILALTISPVVLRQKSAEALPDPSVTTLAVTTGASTASVSIEASSATGTFVSSTLAQSAKFTVTTNNYTGYYVALTNSDTDTTGELINSETSTSIDSLATATPLNTFKTSSDTDLYNNKWGYLPNICTSGCTSDSPVYSPLDEDSTFLPAPTSTNPTITVASTACANGTTRCPNGTDYYSLALGARIDYTKPTGSYANTFSLNAIANPATYYISYNDNSEDGTVEGLPAAQSAESTTATAVTLSDSVPTRENYTFLGWCTSATTDSATVCPDSATTYQPGDTIDIDQTKDNVTALYALWQLDVEYTAMQDFTASMCSSLASDGDYTLKDARDDNTYTVRYINGNCWMTQNLRFTGTELSSTTSNVANTYTDANPYKINNTGTWGNLTSGSSFDEARMHNSGSKTTGVWYNYAGASAGTITGTSNSNTQVYDICPKGWRLPTNAEQNTVTSYASEFNAGGGGFYSGGKLAYEQIAYWWSATFYSTGSNGSRYYLAYNNDESKFYTGGHDRPAGIFVRCIKDTGISGVSSMQAFGRLTGTDRSAVLASMTTGTSYTLADERDGATYTVAKLGDGNVWMTQNLRYVGDSGSSSGSMIMKSTTSNITEDTTLTYADLTSGNSNTQPRIHNSGNTTNGVWYNYAAASAGTITGDSNTMNTGSDVCPSGWRLPTYAEQSGITSYSSQYKPTTGGIYYNASNSDTGNGYWWSVTSQDGTNRYFLNYNGSSLATSRGNRNNGLYIRCIAKEPIESLTMQELGALTPAEKSNYLSTMVTGKGYNLRDTRDGQGYTIAKFADGNVWMVDNLNLGASTISTDLTSANTNLVTTVPSSAFNSWKRTSGNSPYTAGSFYLAAGSDTTSKTAYGTLYNYYAASAATITESANTVNATVDICPSGWRLPTGGASSEFSAFYANSAYNTLAKMRAALPNGAAFTATSGGYGNGWAQGSYGNWWSSTRANDTQMYVLDVETSKVNATTGATVRNYGESIRCLLK